jgi:hypothetical protein
MASPDLMAAASSGPAARPYVLAWYACDLTGAIIEELPSLATTQALSRRLGTYTTLSADLTLKGAPQDWDAATAPGRSMLVAVDTETNTPIWPGLSLTRTGGSASTVSLGLVTPEAYFDRRYTGTIALSQQDQATVMTAVMASAMTGGPPLVMDAPATGVLMDCTLQDSDDKTILSAASDIMAAEGGPEWTVDVAWNGSGTGFVLPVRVRPAIGVQTSTPEGTFDYPGTVSSYTLTESYEQGKGATVVQARGEGEGDSRVTSQVHTATDLIAAGWGRFTYRYTPAAGLTDPAALDAHAAASLALMQTGGAVWTVEATASRAPRLGVDWGLGDTVRLAVESSPRHPGGADVAARAWSWELDAAADKIRPILVEDA